MRVVFDSNVIVAAYATHGLCHQLFELCLVNHSLVISQDILEEVSDKLQNKIKVPSKIVKEILSSLKKSAILEKPIELRASICRDPDDIKILGLAVASHSECLVTGDQDLLVLREIEGIPILSPREFYNHLQKGDRRHD